MMEDLLSLGSGLIEIMREASTELSRRFLNSRVVSGRGGTTITDADLALDSFLVDHLVQLNLNASVDSEESSLHSAEGEAKYTWIVDPLDGSQNFAIGLPLFGSCVSLLNAAGQPVMAAACIPITSELLYADVKLSYYRSGVHTHLKDPTTTEPTRVALLRGNEVSRDDAVFLEMSNRLSVTMERVFQTRSPVQDLAVAATGGIDALVGLKCTGHEMPAVLHLLKHLGFALIPGPDSRPNRWQIPNQFLVARPRHAKKILSALGWSGEK